MTPSLSNPRSWHQWTLINNKNPSTFSPIPGYDWIVRRSHRSKSNGYRWYDFVPTGVTRCTTEYNFSVNYLQKDPGTILVIDRTVNGTAKLSWFFGGGRGGRRRTVGKLSPRKILIQSDLNFDFLIFGYNDTGWSQSWHCWLQRFNWEHFPCIVAAFPRHPVSRLPSWQAGVCSSDTSRPNPAHVPVPTFDLLERLGKL